MKDVAISTKNGIATVSSKEVAEKFEKTHRHVLRDIGSLECSDEFRESNFGRSSYTSSQNKVLPCYDITRDGFAFLAMGFTGKEAAQWKEKYIKAFNAMEAELVRQSNMEDDSVMALLNKAVYLMEDDKDKASAFGQGLAEWKRKKKEHTQEIKTLVSRAQTELKFDI